MSVGIIDTDALSERAEFIAAASHELNHENFHKAVNEMLVLVDILDDDNVPEDVSARVRKVLSDATMIGYLYMTKTLT